MKKEKSYYLGLDIGTDSVGYAVTDEKYNLLKHSGESAWGVTVFDEAEHNQQRRGFRSARRRLDRKQQRVSLLQELFAYEIAKVDEGFFKRIRESALFRNDVSDEYILFNDENYTDKDYYNQYPTIHHLIDDLMKNDNPHDVRLVYLACAWLVSHRGHFLNNIDKNNISDLTDFKIVYDEFINYFETNGYDIPWDCEDKDALANALSQKISIKEKNKIITKCLYNGQALSKEGTEGFPFNREIMIKLLAGSKCKLKDLFNNDEYDELGSISLGMDEEKFVELMDTLGEDYGIIAVMRSVFDWSILVDSLGGHSTISESKVAVYKQHKEDLKLLKYIIKKYKYGKYNEVFRLVGPDNYAAYAYHSDESDSNDLKKKYEEEFSKYILKVIEDIKVQESDKVKFEDMKNRLNLRTFLPKQKNTNNRVLPHQLYWYELHCLLKNAEKYLPFLTIKEDEFTTSEKIESIFLFKIPYFVGPLNTHSSKAWIERKAGKIYPWNFSEMVDLDKSEANFISKMINKCSYLPDEAVLPKCSLKYQKFMVLNIINNLRINGEKISVDLKQKIYEDLFLNVKKITKKKICNYLICNNIIEKGQEETLTGVDITINASCTSYIAFRNLINQKILTEEDVEKIIERASYSEEKSRLYKWLEKMYPQISEVDKKYICNLKIKDFGRLSKKLLCEFEGVDKQTGEVTSIMRELWETQNNLNELLSKEYTFAERIREYQINYYTENPKTLSDRLDEMYISNAVKRPIFRTLAIVKDIEKAFGAPKRIFIEMTRGEDADKKGKRTKSRKEQILELYQKCKDEDVRLLKQELEAMGDSADYRLRGEKLFYTICSWANVCIVANRFQFISWLTTRFIM